MEDTGAERRKSERRVSLLPAYAVLPGRIQIKCVVENLSNGGALLSFTEGAAPTQSFRLLIAGTKFNLLCETLHRAGRKLGVRFVSVADAEELENYVNTLPEVEHPAPSLPLNSPALPSVRDLRKSVLGIGGKTSAGEAGETPPQ